MGHDAFPMPLEVFQGGTSSCCILFPGHAITFINMVNGISHDSHVPQVLQDVVRSMFDTAYVEKLFTPQEVYSLSTTRKIFEKLAHSS